MTWGEQNTPEQAFEQLDYALEQGVNFIDTAEMYPIPPAAKHYGGTESIIGDWMQARGNRDQVVLATKIAGKADWISHIRDGKNRLDRNNILAAVDTSLQRLKTDHIDLYQLHWPDRSTNYFGKLGYYPNPNEQLPVLEETLGALHEAVKAGKIRQIGVSNETPWGVMKYLQLSDQHDQPRMQSIQNPYSLLNRTFEVGLSEVAHREQVGLLAYSPLGFGVLSGKYLNDQRPKGSRLSLFPQYSRYFSGEGVSATQAYVDLANEHGLNPAQMALAFVNIRPFVTSNIIGATTMEQLKDNIASIDLELSDDVLSAIDEIHTRHPNPSP